MFMYFDIICGLLAFKLPLKIANLHQASFGKQDPTGTGSKRFTLKRSHDQMTTMNTESRIETAGHSVGKVTGD